MKPLIPEFEQPVFNIPLGPLADVVGFESIPLHGFGLLVAAGFLIGGRIAMRRADRVGLDSEMINKLIGWLVLGTFVGGHVGYGLMYEPDKYLSNPIEFLKVWQGLSSFGGFVVCAPLAAFFLYRNRLPVWAYLDCLAYGLTVGWFLGRMGCFVAHDHPGTPTNFFLGVYATCPGQGSDIACHDMGLYEALFSLTLFGVFYLLDRTPRVPGFYPLLLGAAYGPVRFAMDFLRPESTDARYFGLTPGQYWATAFFLFCSTALYLRIKSGDAPIWSNGDKEEESG